MRNGSFGFPFAIREKKRGFGSPRGLAKRAKLKEDTFLFGYYKLYKFTSFFSLVMVIYVVKLQTNREIGRMDRS